MALIDKALAAARESYSKAQALDHRTALAGASRELRHCAMGRRVRMMKFIRARDSTRHLGSSRQGALSPPEPAGGSFLRNWLFSSLDQPSAPRPCPPGLAGRP
jgi:hypothetical protein